MVAVAAAVEGAVEGAVAISYCRCICIDKFKTNIHACPQAPGIIAVIVIATKTAVCLEHCLDFEVLTSCF